MDSILNRLKTVLMLKSNSQRLGALIMLLSSFAFFNFITWSPYVLFPRHYCIVVTVGGFLIGAVLAHGIQKTTYRFLEIVGVNLYIIGWAFIINGLLVAQTYLEVYFNGVLGVYIVFLGVVFYFMHRENPTRFIIENHILVGSFLIFVGTTIFLLAHFEADITLFYLIRIGRLPAFWSDRAIVSVLVGIGILLISLFMYFLPPYVKGRSEGLF
ncbi:hypothetical protein AVEN_133635-1 [Araneus ventricosus]|uniref:Uncharacterized protein n=1 Tax=Araneus ventricosus TaxID=182803 RepID=A0A4Y2MU12_ARAVE|nr:hypothetical protein AVEN_133635-1 [Araneus ventricosus]